MIDIHRYTSFLAQMCWPIYKYFSFRSCLRQCKWYQVHRQLCHLRQDPNQRKVQNQCWASCKFRCLLHQTLPIANVAKCHLLQRKHPKAEIENIFWVRNKLLYYMFECLGHCYVGHTHIHRERERKREREKEREKKYMLPHARFG